jgi:glyoxylase-like metal-dependent hydrolase (beta-lactamase superfamily II)
VEIHQVKGRHVNSYIVLEASGMFVVDVAWKGEKYVLGHITEVLRRSPAEVRLVTCTHGDPDHAGGVAELARACGAKVAYPYATHSFMNRLPGFDGWQTLHTPGHTWDSCCYYHQASGSLVTGDTLLGSKKKGQVVTASIYSNPLQLRRSVRRLRKLNPAAIYPGHGSVFYGTDLLEHL